MHIMDIQAKILITTKTLRKVEAEFTNVRIIKFGRLFVSILSVGIRVAVFQFGFLKLKLSCM